ncbi:hypothetical protein GJ496_005501 [Pomphorhynchus laevis]|nr:hypothetical protein GJ496_005501 [Pomphorhynchus laevis]
MLICSIICLSTYYCKYTADWDSLDSRPLPSWYGEAKIGIFIHWGLYSVPAFHSEWFWYYWKAEGRPEFDEFVRKTYGDNFKYADFAPMFKASRFNSSYWADLFADSGAKYVVLTSKHHEGFALWPSNYSWMWNSVDVGPHIDIVGALSKATRTRDIKFGVYYSLYEWFNPWYMCDTCQDFEFGEKKAFNELKHLVETYTPDVIWSDGDWEKNDTYWKSKEFLAYLYNDSPVKDTVVVNDRWGIGTYCTHGGFWNCEDHYIPNSTLNHKWENAFSLDKKSWGYRADIKSNEVMSIEDLIKETVISVSMNGNVLINVGPSSEGIIPAIMEDRLRSLGAWLKINGRAIYNSRIVSFSSNDCLQRNSWFTRTNQSLYIICTDIQVIHQDVILFGSIPENVYIRSISLLGCPQLEVTWNRYKSVTSIYIPENACLHTLKWAFVLSIAEI